MVCENKQYKRLVLTAIDLEQASSWGKYIVENDLFDESENSNKVLVRALQTAMIVAYIRPFSGNKETGDTISRPMLLLNSELTSSQLNLHNRMQTKRNTVFAHSDSDVRDLTISVSEINGQSVVSPISNNPYVLSKNELLEFVELIETVRGLVTKKMIELKAKMKPNSKF